VGIARAISMQPKYLFVDEPNSGLDPKTSIVIDDLINEITEEYQITTIVVTHDMNSVMGIGERILFLYEGQKEWEGTNKEIAHTDNQALNDFVFASKFTQAAKDKL
jgi:phospholipid/cholesterol/gamma-HCH transport system ATP-binding protein